MVWNLTYSSVNIEQLLTFIVARQIFKLQLDDLNLLLQLNDNLAYFFSIKVVYGFIIDRLRSLELQVLFLWLIRYESSSTLVFQRHNKRFKL